MLAMLFAIAMSACGGREPLDDAGVDVPDVDAGNPINAGGVDAGAVVDEDAGASVDEDAGETIDAGETVDAGESIDAGEPVDDAGEPDAGDASDAGETVDDAGEGEVVDAGEGDDVDAGPADDEDLVIVGTGAGTLLRGTVLTPFEVLDNAEVLVVGDTIVCVGDCALDAAAQDATIIDTRGIIAPGLIDTHNHILFDIFDETHWSPLQLYDDHDDWTAEARYREMLDVKQCLANDSQGKPPWCADTPFGTSTGSLRCEMDKWGELKGLIAGTTSIVGLPGTSSGCFGSLARSIDVSQNGLGADRIRTSATFPPSRTTADGVCADFADDSVDAFLVHCGEGTSSEMRDELTTLRTVPTVDDCLLSPRTTITHGTAFLPEDFALLAATGVNLTWSPRSNMFLYGATTDVVAARDNGVVIALAPDWSLGGSQNLLDELAFADALDDEAFGDAFTAQELVHMTTTNAAHVLGLSERLGSIEVGKLADLVVFSRLDANPPSDDDAGVSDVDAGESDAGASDAGPSDAGESDAGESDAGDNDAGQSDAGVEEPEPNDDDDDVYRAVLQATPRTVRLVMVGGVVLYGDRAYERAMPSDPGCESIDVCGADKRLCVATTSTLNKLNQTYAEIEAALFAAFALVDEVRPDVDGQPFIAPTPIVRCE